MIHSIMKLNCIINCNKITVLELFIILSIDWKKMLNFQSNT